MLLTTVTEQGYNWASEDHNYFTTLEYVLLYPLVSQQSFNCTSNNDNRCICKELAKYINVYKYKTQNEIFDFIR